ncbi:MAG: CHAD domain-containing protein [Rhodocyclaceae bacterium]|nr:CHAD domain-containing protein [Rhodocyclaceae bacterium]
MGTEVELKLGVSAPALRALKRHPLITDAERAARTATLISTYFDTPDQRLAAERVSVRTRKQGRRLLQTVKGDARSSSGLSVRPEWEQTYRGAFDFEAVDDPRIRKLLQAHVSALEAIFVTEFRRETFRCRPHTEASVLVMIDHGTITAGGRTAPICEVELELERGQAPDLFELAASLAHDIALRPINESKAARGLRLFHGDEQMPKRAGPSPVGAGDSPLGAFRRIAEDCLDQWQANAHGAAVDHAPEFIHQIRVSLRRLRSALRLFEPALPPDWVARWSTEFSEAADELGEARDIDVLHEELIVPILEDPLCPAQVQELNEAVVAARNRAREHVRSHMEGTGQGRRMLTFAAELNRLEANPLDASADLTAFARLQLDVLRKRARKRWRKARAGDIAQLHALRISLKKLRYAIEFFTPLFPRKPVKRFIAKLARAQEHLGYLNDIEVGNQRMLQWAGDSPSLLRAAAYVAGWHGAMAAQVRRQVLPEIAAVLDGSSPWRATGRARRT